MTDLAADLQAALSGTYSLERELGGGGMSRVFLATEMALGRRVVIKVLPADLAIDLSAERFAREIQLAAALQHPCIVPVLTAGLAGSVPFYTMPYVEGRTLRDRLTERPQLPVPEALDVLRDISSALALAHSHYIVHRDIKPENILLSGGYAQVTDFGIARAISASRVAAGSADIDRARITRAGLAIGSPPEQVAGDDAMDQRVDIYALGCLAYELFAGVPPFSATDPHLILRAHVSETPANVRNHRPDLPEDIATIVMRSLEKDRELRPQTATELVDFFRAPRPVAVRAPRPTPPVAPAPKVPRWAWYMTFTTALAAVAVGIFAVWPRAQGEKSIAVLPFTNLSGDTAQDFFADGIADDLTHVLAGLPGIRVASRTSAFSFKGRTVDPREVGKQLNVTEVLEGSVRRTGSGLRINAMLVRASDGKSQWTQTFDRPDSDLFEVQDEITRDIARALHVKLAHPESLRSGHVPSVQAHEAYLRGLEDLYHRHSELALRSAVASFTQAVSLDSEHARAHAGLAAAYTSLADFFVPPADAYPQAIAEANRAIELDSASTEAMATLGFDILIYKSDPEAAKALFDEALRQDSGSARAYERLSWYELAMRRPKRAVVAAQRALELDPLSAMASGLVEWWWLMARQPDSAIVQHRRTTTFANEFIYHDSFLGEAYRQKGMLNEALAEYERASTALGHPTSGHIITLHALGRTDEARQLLTKLEAQWPGVYVPPELIAAAHARLGDFDGAMQWLQKGAETKSGLAPLVGVLYDLEPLYDDPRYEALLKQLGIPEEIDTR